MAEIVPPIPKRTRRVIVAAIGAVAMFSFAFAPRAAAQRSQGLDVSDWQGTISWTSVHNAGKDFAFIRSSRGGTTGFYDENDANNVNGLNTLSQRYDDTKFYANIDAATSVGMFAGPYHFGRADIIATTTNANGIANTGA